jgi:adenylate kinase family enzyme
MIFILEGPDGSGKSTLARALCRLLNAGYIHNGPPQPDEDVFTTYEQQVQHVYHTNMIIDRWALGESIYGPLYRKTDQLGVLGQFLLHYVSEVPPAYHILCLPSWEVCRANWLARRADGHEYVVDDTMFRAVYDAYDAIRQSTHSLSHTLPPYHHYDYTCMSIRDALRGVIR